MSVYQRGTIWWFTFWFRGQRIQESTSSRSNNLAIRAERERRRQLEEGVNHLKADKRPTIFGIYPKQYLDINTPHWSRSNIRIEGYNLQHLTEHFGKLLLTDITAVHISKYQAHRKAARGRKPEDYQYGGRDTSGYSQEAALVGKHST